MSDDVPRCACGARILTPPDMACPLCSMLAASDLELDDNENTRDC